MPTYHRRRPAPLILDIRQATTTSIESPDSPSPTGGPPSPDSPDLPSATTSSFPPSTTAAPAPSTAISASELQASSTPPSLSSTLITSQTPSSPTSSTSLAEPGRASSTPSPTPSTPVQASSTAVQSSAQVSSAPRVNVSSSSQAIEVTFSSGAIDVTSSVLATISSTAAPDARSSRIKATPPSPTTTVTSILSTPSSTALPDNDDNKGNEPPRKATQQSKSTMSKGAEAALITIAVLGALALVIALVVFLKRRRRRHESALRHAEDAFDPSNTGSLQHPEGVHHADIHTTSSGTGSHMTQSTMTSSALFAGDPDHRPETISTDPSRSRFQAIPAYAPSVASTIQTPMPSANPFADPPRNKAYDVLRGRPRSTTLTDPNRGSWVKNPFKDPVSERFDPFGELQERARNERVRYIEELRMEQEQLEKDRVAMSGGGLDGRKGSGVTVEGLGVLDRAGGGGGYRGVS